MQQRAMSGAGEYLSRGEGKRKTTQCIPAGICSRRFGPPAEKVEGTQKELDQ
jgi:hypothetical protein